MTTLSRRELQRLTARHEPPCVSIYFPTIRKDDTAQNVIRFKNLLRKAERVPVDDGHRPGAIAMLMARAAPLLKDGLLWDRMNAGAAVFLSPDFFEIYSLPYAVPEEAIVNRRFYIKPLLPLAADDARFFILAVSRAGARLLEATRHGAQEIPLNLPAGGLVGALGLKDRETSRSFSVERSGTIGAVHGREVDKVDRERLRQYFALIDRAVRDALRAEHAPLVLAGVDYELPVYRDVTRYPGVEAAAVDGSPEGLGTAELHRRAWKLIGARFDRELENALGAYRALDGTARVSSDLRAILGAAQDGRVQSLFVTRAKNVWGSFLSDTREVRLHRKKEPGDEDLLDLAGVRALETGGRVFELPPDRMPASAAVGAVFRY